MIISSRARGAGSPESGRPGRSDRLLPPTARRRLRLWLSSRLPPPRAPHPTRAPPPARSVRLSPNKESGCDAREPRGAPGTRAGTRLWGRSSGAGARGRASWRMARGSSANRRAPPRPPDVARRKMLQPWTAPRSTSQVQGAAAEGGSAAGTAAASRGMGGGKRKERPPENSPPRPAPSWLAGKLQSSSGHLRSRLCWPGQGTHSARLWGGGVAAQLKAVRP